VVHCRSSPSIGTAHGDKQLTPASVVKVSPVAYSRFDSAHLKVVGLHKPTEENEMKIPLYLIAMRSNSTGKALTWISTHGYNRSDDVVVLDEFEFEYETKHSEEEIDALLGIGRDKEIETLEAKLEELRNAS